MADKIITTFQCKGSLRGSCFGLWTWSWRFLPLLRRWSAKLISVYIPMERDELRSCRSEYVTHCVIVFSMRPFLITGTCCFNNTPSSATEYCKKKSAFPNYSAAVWVLQVNFLASLRCWKLQWTCLRVKHIKQIFGLASWHGKPLMQFLAPNKTKQQMERGKAFPSWTQDERI